MEKVELDQKNQWAEPLESIVQERLLKQLLTGNLDNINRKGMLSRRWIEEMKRVGGPWESRIVSPQG